MKIATLFLGSSNPIAEEYSSGLNIKRKQKNKNRRIE